MIVIIISVGYKKILDILSQYEHIHFIKRKGIQLFLYYDIKEEQANESIRWTKDTLVSKMGKGYVIQIFSLLHGKIDFFSDIPEEKRNSMSYFNSLSKDLPDTEIQDFLQKHPEIENRL
ncbi:MAG: hypothetical protein Q4C49_07590 [Bacillota bacterium]|nr:hypothetical protein [Bacillota bacterium]